MRFIEFLAVNEDLVCCRRGNSSDFGSRSIELQLAFLPGFESVRKLFALIFFKDDLRYDKAVRCLYVELGITVCGTVCLSANKGLIRDKRRYIFLDCCLVLESGYFRLLGHVLPDVLDIVGIEMRRDRFCSMVRQRCLILFFVLGSEIIES